MKTLFDKIWDKHIIKKIEDGPFVLYIDRQFIHEVTSPVAFSGLDDRGIGVMRPKQTTATVDHNIPTLNQHLPIKDELSRTQVEALQENCKKHNIRLYGIGDKQNGIVHVIGPELGYTQPGMTIVCGDSHTSTHGAFGSIAFGIGTSEVEMVLASQCLLQSKPKTMRINVNGELPKGLTAKDIVLYVISQLSTSGATGYFIEFAGSAIRNLSMEGRMTVCNMSIEMGARGGMIAPDEKTFEYVKNREFAPKGKDFDKAIKEWKKLFSDKDAKFDKEFSFNAANIQPMVTYGTNPGMGIKITEKIPSLKDISDAEQANTAKALKYMQLEPGASLLGKEIDYVFIGSCTNGRIEDLREAAALIKARKKANNVTVWVVPGSKKVLEQAEKEGLAEIFKNAGCEWRQPGCSACLAMNDDKIPEGKYCVATSNRNFEGRQGQGSRTILASPITAIAAAITGKITDPRNFL